MQPDPVRRKEQILQTLEFVLSAHSLKKSARKTIENIFRNVGAFFAVKRSDG
jgi:hypothetical protein